MLHLWCPETSTIDWHGTRSFRLQTLKLSVGSSAFHVPSGIQYVSQWNILILTLSDGSFHVIHDLLNEPSMKSPEDMPLTSKSLSVAIRNAFIQTEQGADFQVVNRITGVTSYDNSATLIWVHESSRPADFSYKHDAKHCSTIVIARAWEDRTDDELLEDMARVIRGTKTASGSSPLHLLRPFLFLLRDRRRLEALRRPLLDILKPPAEDHSLQVGAPQLLNLTTEARKGFRLCLSQNLFGWDMMLSLRLRLSLADFAIKHSDVQETTEEFEGVAQTLLIAISHRILRTIIRHLIAIAEILTAEDIPFVSRMVVQSLLDGSPPDLSEEGRHLWQIARAAVTQGEQPPSAENSFNERCPACNSEVPLQDITSAVCPNGHMWARCSITTFILSTHLVRTCVVCCRKAFLPLSMPNSPSKTWLPKAAQSWVVEELLEAVHRCLFCNNNFISVL